MSDAEYVLLHEIVEPEDVMRLAGELGWVHVQTITATPARFHEEIWRAGDDEDIVRYIEDHFVRMRYLVVRGPHRRRIVEDVEGNITTTDHEDAFRMALEPGEDEDELQEMAVRAIAVLGAAGDRARILDTYSKVLKSPSIDARQAVILSISRLAWPEFQPMLAEAASSDPDPDTREQAADLLEILRKLSAGSTKKRA